MPKISDLFNESKALYNGEKLKCSFRGTSVLESKRPKSELIDFWIEGELKKYLLVFKFLKQFLYFFL